MQVYQSETSLDDLQILAKGSVLNPYWEAGFEENCMTENEFLAEKVIAGCCNAFSHLNKTNPMFHLRDFIYFCRYWRNNGEKKGKYVSRD